MVQQRVNPWCLFMNLVYYCSIIWIQCLWSFLLPAIISFLKLSLCHTLKMISQTRNKFYVAAVLTIFTHGTHYFVLDTNPWRFCWELLWQFSLALSSRPESTAAFPCDTPQSPNCSPKRPEMGAEREPRSLWSESGLSSCLCGHGNTPVRFWAFALENKGIRPKIVTTACPLPPYPSLGTAGSLQNLSLLLSRTPRVCDGVSIISQSAQWWLRNLSQPASIILSVFSSLGVKKIYCRAQLTVTIAYIYWALTLCWILC